MLGNMRIQLLNPAWNLKIVLFWFKEFIFSALVIIVYSIAWILVALVKPSLGLQMISFVEIIAVSETSDAVYCHFLKNLFSLVLLVVLLEQKNKRKLWVEV